jgi:hypothetical protein
MSKINPFTIWVFGIAVWGAITGTVSLGIQWRDSRDKFREPLDIKGNIDTNNHVLTFTVRNRHPQIPARIEKVHQLRRRNWWSNRWFEFQTDAILHNGKAIELPFEVSTRTIETYTIKDKYFANAINRARNRNAEPVLFDFRAGSGYSFRLRPNINGKAQA